MFTLSANMYLLKNFGKPENKQIETAKRKIRGKSKNKPTKESIKSNIFFKTKIRNQTDLTA